MPIVRILRTNAPFFVDVVIDNVGLIVGIEKTAIIVVTVRVSQPLDRMDSLTRLKVPARFAIRFRWTLPARPVWGEHRVNTTRELPCRF
jgi:hypothetical protein